MDNESETENSTRQCIAFLDSLRDEIKGLGDGVCILGTSTWQR
jgi:hypothetical protein